MKAKKTKRENTMIVIAQLTYIDKSGKSIDPKKLPEKVNEGFKKLADAGNQPWDDIQIKDVKVFERD